MEALRVFQQETRSSPEKAQAVVAALGKRLGAPVVAIAAQTGANPSVLLQAMRAVDPGALTQALHAVTAQGNAAPLTKLALRTIHAARTARR